MSERTEDNNFLQTAGFLFEWWLHELTYFVPRGLREVFVHGELAVLAIGTVSGSGINNAQTCRLIEEGSSEGLLMLGPEVVYAQRLEFPFLSSESLNQAVRFEALRRNPLSRDLSCFDYRVVERDFVRRRISVDLLVVRQTTLDIAIEFASSAAVRLRGVCIEGSSSPTRLQHLLRPTRGLEVLSARQKRLLRQVSVAATLAAGIALSLAGRLHLEETNIQTELNQLQKDARASEPVRLQSQALSQQVDTLNAARKKSIGISVVAELTHRLPDSVWLRQFSASTEGIHLQGLAQRSPSLIGILSASPLFKRVVFSGPIIKEGRRNLEQFSLDLDVR